MISGLECTVAGLHVNSRFQPDGPQLHLALSLDGLSLRGQLPILSLRRLSIEAKVRYFNYNYLLILYAKIVIISTR